jgi:putative membrane protein
MFIDYLTLIMFNLIAGTVLLAYYLWKGMDEKDKRPYASAFFVTGLLSFITGLQLSFTWPLPGSFNIAYGDASVLFGVVFLAAGISLWQGWSLIPVTIYAFLAGADSVVIGARILSLGLGKEPTVAFLGFLLAGLGGLGSFPFFMWFKDNKTVRWIGIIVLLATALVWIATFYPSIWGHLESFGKWVPATMASPKP